MAGSFEEDVVELLGSRGLEFNRDDKRELDIMLALEPDLDRVHRVEEKLFEGLWLIVADPAYRGDLTVADLESGPDPDRDAFVGELIKKLLG